MSWRYVVTVLVVLLSGAAVARADDDQVGYDGCVDFYNQKRKGLEREWAFVVGVSGNSSRCFWAWGKKEGYTVTGVDQALFAAAGNCRKAGFSLCAPFADSKNGLSAWARHISNQGGRSDQTIADQGRRRDDSNAAAAAIIGGFVSGLGSAASSSRRPQQSGSYYNRPSSGRNRGGGGSGNCPGATIATDQNCRPLH